MAKKTAEKKYELVEVVNNPYLSHAAKVLSNEKLTSDTYLLRIKPDFQTLPGQFIEVSVPLYGEAPISVGSHSKDYLDLLVRNVGNVSNQIVKLKEGDEMQVRGPYGKGYPLDVLKGNNLVIISGGTGTAPIRSVLQYVDSHRNEFGDINLFLGFRSPEMVLFRKDIEEWQKKYSTTVSVDSATTMWSGKVGVITKYIESSGLNNQNKVAFLCGPPVMIKFAIEALKKLGFNNDQIFVSVERNMKCGIGKCGHCMIHGKYSCKDGPVFRYDELAGYKED